MQLVDGPASCTAIFNFTTFLNWDFGIITSGGIGEGRGGGGIITSGGIGERGGGGHRH